MISSSLFPPTLEWPLKLGSYITLFLYILSLVTRNVSQVDRLWATLPTVYAAYWALLPLLPQTAPFPLFPYVPASVDRNISATFSPRALLMFTLTIIWSCRLNYNTIRKNLFTWNEEDYRWAILRQKLSSFQFQVTNLVFVAIIQNIILFLLSLPVQFAICQPHTSLTTSDYILFAFGVAVHILEFTADNQHQSFHKYKKTGSIDPNDWIGARIQWTPADAKRGFVTRGLWAWSRHPNFLCEQLCWIVINLFPLLSPEGIRMKSLTTSPTAALRALAPCLVHCFLFFNSTIFTESITSAKYQGYAAYQQRVSMFVPWLTPVWGFLLQLKGKKGEIDEIVYGKGLKEE